MSHVATINIEVKDLDALAAAAAKLGGKLIRDQKTYGWFGQHVGDYPLPEGFTAEDLGKCEHAIHFQNTDYEVGLVRRRDGRPGWQLLWDFFDSTIVKNIGQNGGHLKREYATVVATRQAQRNGFRVVEQRKQDGSVRLVLSR